MRGIMLTALLVLVALMPLGCSRDSWEITSPGLSEPEQTTLSFSATCNQAQDGWPVYISGYVVPGYTDNPHIRVPFSTYENGHVEGNYLWWSWGNEKKVPVWLWVKSPDDVYYRMLDIQVGGTTIYGSAGSNEWETTRSFSVFLENGEIRTSSDGPDSLIAAQIWYTGTGLPDRNWPADPDQPVEWLGTWTGFQDKPHPMDFVEGRWTTNDEDIRVKKGTHGYLRLQKQFNGDELRAGVYFGPKGNFEAAKLMKCMFDFGGGYVVFEYSIAGSGEFENPRDRDERMYGVNIGGNP